MFKGVVQATYKALSCRECEISHEFVSLLTDVNRHSHSDNHSALNFEPGHGVKH